MRPQRRIEICLVLDMEIFYFRSRQAIVIYGQAPWPKPLFDFCGRKRKKTNGKLGKLSFQFRLWDKLLVVSHAAHKLNAQLHHFWLSHLGGFQTNQQKALNRDVWRWGGRGASFGISVNPIWTKGGRLCPPYYYCPPPSFWTMRRLCHVSMNFAKRCGLVRQKIYKVKFVLSALTQAKG